MQVFNVYTLGVIEYFKSANKLIEVFVCWLGEWKLGNIGSFWGTQEEDGLNSMIIYIFDVNFSKNVIGWSLFGSWDISFSGLTIGQCNFCEKRGCNSACESVRPSRAVPNRLNTLFPTQSWICTAPASGSGLQSIPLSWHLHWKACWRVSSFNSYCWEKMFKV